MKNNAEKTQRKTNGTKQRKICIWHLRKNILELLSNAESIG